MITINSDVIEKTIFLNAPVMRVYRTISEPADFRQWFLSTDAETFASGDTPEVRCDRGGPYRIAIGEMRAPTYFGFTWAQLEPVGTDGSQPDPRTVAHTTVEFVLTPTGEGTEVRLRESGFGTLAPQAGTELYGKHEEGWNHYLRELRSFIDAEMGKLGALPADAIERSVVIRAPVERVFRAISTAEEFGQWFSHGVEGEFTVGSQPIIDEGSYGKYRLAIMACDPHHYFAYRWVSDSHFAATGFLDDPLKHPSTLVEYRLRSVEDGTEVTVRESGFSQLPEFYAAKNYGDNTDGWEYQMESLRKFVEGS